MKWHVTPEIYSSLWLLCKSGRATKLCWGFTLMVHGRHGLAHPGRHGDGREKILPGIQARLVERDLAVIRSKLNDSDFARFWAEGQSMTVDEALALALKDSAII